MLERIAHSKDSIVAYMKQHPLLKNDQDLELHAEHKAVMWIKHRAIVRDESTPNYPSGTSFETPEECIRKDGTIDHNVFMIKYMRGELKVMDFSKPTATQTERP